MKASAQTRAASARTALVSPRQGPYAVRVEEGKTYLWCRCGRSESQPWCDGKHIGTGLEPVEFIAPISETFYMCGCKRSDNPPFCFGNCRGNDRRTSAE